MDSKEISFYITRLGLEKHSKFEELAIKDILHKDSYEETPTAKLVRTTQFFILTILKNHGGIPIKNIFSDVFNLLEEQGYVTQKKPSFKELDSMWEDNKNA